MTQVTQSGKVLVIGASIGGLVLAQILKKNDVPFELFERDERLDSRKQGWAIALVESVHYLPRALWTTTTDIGFPGVCQACASYFPRSWRRTYP